MSFGLPAYHEEEVPYDCSPIDLMDAALNALEELGWRCKESGKWCIKASTGINLLSWGERITIRIDVDSYLFIRSQCSWPTQIIDWGRNADNVRRFLRKLDVVLDDYDYENRRQTRDDSDEPRKPSSRHVSDRSGTSSSPSPRRPRPDSGDDSIRR